MLKVSAYQKINLPEKVVRPNLPTPADRQNKAKDGQLDFKTTLNKAVEEGRNVNFSAHARARLFSRGVQMDEAKIEALSQAIDKAKAKGSRESLVLSDDRVFA